MNEQKREYVFGLDIGTSSIVGTVGYRVSTDRFVVIGQRSKAHETRAMLDGQIHDISAVSNSISIVKKELEEDIGFELKDVAIAAAGRVLKTKQVYVEYEMPSETKVTEEHIRSLNSLAVEQAYQEVSQDQDHKDKRFFCVGYSPVKYYLNGYPMESIEQHQANRIAVDLLATFLPDEVVDGLYSAVEDAGLSVESLTLEPIAAIHLAIPERFRLLNIALVDVGAGTSDISIVKDGSIIAFGMMPIAGDEITEVIAQNYLVDFATAEMIKKESTLRKSVSFRNIFGENLKCTQEEIQQIYEGAVDSIAKKIADKIIELNGGNTVGAIFVVGGGGKITGFTEALAKHIGLPENRVAIRGAEVMEQIEFAGVEVKRDSTLVTPIGICLESYENCNEFIRVTLNDQRIKLYDNGHATILDACIHAGYSQDHIFPIRGDELVYEVNGEEKVIKGRMGEPAQLKNNGKEAMLNDLVQEGDVIHFIPSSKGEKIEQLLYKLPECNKNLSFQVFGSTILCPKQIMVNGKIEAYDYVVQPRDKIQVLETCTVQWLFEFMGEETIKQVLVNGQECGLHAEIKDNDVIERDQIAEMLELDPPSEEEVLKEETAVEEAVTEKETEKETKEEVKPVVETKAKEEPAKTQDVYVFVNNDKVLLKPKEKHTFVDVFDVYPFDLTTARGKKLVSRLNGIDIMDFTFPLRAGDQVDLYWD